MKHEILAAVEQYKKAVHTGKAEDFYPIWAKNCETALISISRVFRGSDSIYNDFIVGCIHTAYSRIDLVSTEIDVRPLSDTTAAVIFRYYTDCDRAETGEHYSIKGVETQIYVLEEGAWKLAHVQYGKDSEILS